MTITDVIASEYQTQERNMMKGVGEAVKQVLQQATKDGRLILGSIASADQLSNDAESIAICILPETRTEDVTVNIQHKLIEAYCWENEIPVLKVEGKESLEKILNLHSDENNNEPNDLTCILVKNAQEVSSAEVILTEFFDYVIQNEIEPHPVISLPV